jgi:hypothetical protein
VLLGVVGATALAGLTPVGVADAAPPSYTTLQPGGPADLEEVVPVQVVLLGYEAEDVPPDWFAEYLPNTATPIDRSRTWRALQQRFGEDVRWDTPGVADYVQELGLHYVFDTEVVYTDVEYEDEFFGYLTSIGVDEWDRSGHDTSFFQFLYNLQPGRALDITNNLVIDPVAVERWLVEHPAPGIDPERNTVVFVNWWGRDDFRFHDYEVTGEPQSETGADFAAGPFEGRMIAWGGTAPHNEETGFGRESRTWFHDLSAGPDWRTGGWVIDDRLGGGPDPSWQTIFPPVWEYLAGNAEDRWPLPDALGVITRFVAVDLFFAPSPLYGTDSDARLTEDVELDVTVIGSHGRPLLTPSLLQQEVGDLLGSRPDLDVTRQTFTDTRRRCYDAFLAGKVCRPEVDPAVYTPDADFFLASEREIPQWRDGSAAYEAPGFVYAATGRPKWLGVADDNWSDGARSAAYSLPTTRTLELGYGVTSNLIHEYGHHFGLSHVHDGYESEWGPNSFAANDDEFGVFFFAWVGNEVSSVMSYMDVTNDFSQFDLDNHHRWEATRSLRAANLIAAAVLVSPGASAGHAALSRADERFTAAQEALSDHDYPAADALAWDGYLAAREAAAAASVGIPTTDRWAMLAPGRWQGQRRSPDAVHPGADPVDARVGAAERRSDLVERYESATPRSGGGTTSVS